MDEESALAPEAGPEAIVEAPEGEDQKGQVETPPAEGEEPEDKKTEAAKRREREKAHRERLRSDKEAAEARAAEAERRRMAVTDAGKRETPPREQDFPDPYDFIAAKAVWAYDQRQREREANWAGEAAEAAKREAQGIEAQERAIIQQAWGSQVQAARQRYADFDAVAYAQDVPITEVMSEIIATSDVGADVAYHLGQNKALAAQIARMNPVEAARAIGRIEVSLQLPKPRTETKAPPPISPVRGGASAIPNPDKMSMQEYIAARKAGKL